MAASTNREPQRLEIIHLRLTGEHPEDLVDAIKASIEPGLASDGIMLEGIRFYRRRELNTDLAILIVHHERPATDQPSSLGIRLTRALQAHGLVDHTIWQEIT